MAIDQEWSLIWVLVYSAHNTRHQVANNDEVRDTYTKALDGDSSIEKDGRTWVSDFREGEERCGTALKISGATRLEVETEGGTTSGPDNDDCTEQDSKVSHGQRHGQCSGTNNYARVSAAA